MIARLGVILIKNLLVLSLVLTLAGQIGAFLLEIKMSRSESIKELAAALSKAQGAFDHAKKDVKNEFFKSKYADLASVIDAAKKPLSDNGLSVCQICDTTETGDVILETILMHTSGEFISGRYPIRPVKADPQAMGSAITYARRYAFSAITGIAADDDDGNGASQPVKTKTTAPEPLKYCTDDDFAEKSVAWFDLIKSGKKTANQIITMIQTKYLFTENQLKEINNWEANKAPIEGEIV